MRRRWQSLSQPCASWVLMTVLAWAALACGSAAAQQAGAPPPSKPLLRWITYEPGSIGHVQAVALAQAIKVRTRTEVVVFTSPADPTRHVLLAQGKVDAVMSGLGSVFAQEGVFAYARADLGPQALRLVLGAWSNNVGLVTTGGSGINRLSDLKGRRVGVVGGNPANWHVVQSLLDSVGLAFRDVRRVELAGPVQGPEALLLDKADAVLELTGSTAAYMMAGGPKGVLWLPVPAADEAIWKRIGAKAPYLLPRRERKGAGISEASPHDGAAYPYPALVVRPDAPAAEVQRLAQAVLQGAEDIKGTIPGIEGWDVRLQRLDWVIPFHEGAVAVLKAAGVWTQAAGDHNDRLVARQKVLRQAWDQARAQIKPETPTTDANRIWLITRIRVLQENGFPAVF